MDKRNENFGAYCQVVGDTNVGCKRAANEDFLGQAETQNGLVATVCDGMGGHVGGATASHIAVETIIKVLTEQYFEDPREGISEAIIAANNAILSHAQIHPELQGMGSTCVLLVVRAGRVYLGHVGDSRIYLIRSRRIKQLTKDHSYVQMLVDAGQITHEQAEHHPRKNEITNALGIPEMQPPTVLDDAINPEAGDCFLLCSDGLSGMVSDADIEKIVSKQKEMRAPERINMLIEQARANGGLDNITAQLVEFSITPNPTAGNTSAKNKKVVLPAIIAGVLVLIGLAVFFWMRQSATTEETPAEDATQTGEVVVDPIVKTTSHKDLGSLELESANAVILEIEFSPSTIIRSIGKNSKELYRESISFCKDSVRAVSSNIEILSVSGENCVKISPKDQSGFKKNEKVVFSLENETTIYTFSINIVKSQPTQQTQSTPQTQQTQQPQSSLPVFGKGQEVSDPKGTAGGKKGVNNPTENGKDTPSQDNSTEGGLKSAPQGEAPGGEETPADQEKTTEQTSETEGLQIG